MEENMNLDHGLQYDFIDFMGVGAQHDDDEISAVEHELDPEQENMNLDRGSQYSFIDFMGVGAQHDEFDDDIDDPQELDPAPENVNLDLGLTPYSFMDFVGLDTQHGDDIDIDIDDLIPQEPDPAQVHHHQSDSTYSIFNDTDLEDRVYSPMELLSTGNVELNTPEDRTVQLDLDMRLLPESSMSLLRQDGSRFLTLQLGPTSEPALDPETFDPETLDPETLDPETLDPETLDPETLDPETLDPVTVEDWAVWADIVHEVLSFILMRILITTIM